MCPFRSLRTAYITWLSKGSAFWTGHVGDPGPDSITDVTASSIRATNGIAGAGDIHCPCDFVGVVNVESSSITSTGIALMGNLFSEFHVSHSRLTGGSTSQQINTNLYVEDSTIKNLILGAVSQRSASSAHVFSTLLLGSAPHAGRR